MRVQETKPEKAPEQFTDILLVLDKKKMKIEAVKGIDQNGNLETADPDLKNQSQFMRVDKHGDFLSNFLSNFFRQLKNPSQFSFFHTPLVSVREKTTELQELVDQPSAKNAKALKEQEIKTNQNHMKTSDDNPQKSEYRFTPEQIDWNTMNNLGLGKERLERLNVLEPLLRGYKTNELIPIHLNLGTAVVRTDARLSLQPTPDGKIVAAIHGIRKEPNLNYEFFGHKFTDEDRKNLLQTGNMGRVVNLTHSKTGENIPSLVSVDRLTNELVALRTDFVKIPDDIKGVKLNEQQKQTLAEGKPLHLEGILSKKGAEFSATVQFNADKRYVEFSFDKNPAVKQTVAQNKQDPPTTFRGKELTSQQYSEFKAEQTVYMDNLTDKKGQPYQGYITFNKDTHKTEFSFRNPNSVKEQTQPIEAHKTQVSVNSDGKTNEATKKQKSPVKTGQQNAPKEQEVQPKTKSKGVKM